MIELIWSLINIGIVLYFLFVFVGFLLSGRQIFKGKFRNLSIIILILGGVQIISAAKTGKSENILTIENDHKLHQPQSLKKILLEDNLTQQFHLSVIYSKEENSLTPIKSHCSMTGLVSGFDWKFTSIRIIEDKYFASGVLSWNLFGINIYSQKKNFTGSLEQQARKENQ